MSSYVGAPYNFVPFATPVYTPNTKENLEIHDRIDDALLTGEITYKMEAMTPVFVDSGKGDFFKNESGKCVIPGSSMRGLIRGNVQMLSSSEFERDIDDYSLMYRNVAFGGLKKHYNDVLGNKPVPYGNGNISVLTNVKAGYICCDNGKYYIYPTKLEHVDNNNNLPNYYILSERTVVEQYLNDKNGFSYPFFVRNGESIMQHLLTREFKEDFRNGRKHYQGDQNRSYQPYYEKCSYTSKGKNITGVSFAGELEKDGMVISTGAMQEKKAIYIIPEMDDDIARRIPISEKDIRAFNIDFNRKANTLKSKFGKKNKKDAVKEAKHFYGLPEKGQSPKPVFYIWLDEKLYFGFTPRLRLFYEHSIKEGIRHNLSDDNRFDMATSIFGLSDKDKGSYKSKVSFCDAELISGSVGDSVKVVLAEPKPSSYLDYVIQPSDANRSKTYNDPDFSLRGVKQYWLHKGIDLGKQNSNNENIGSTIKTMSAGSVFYGKIRFENLTNLELGLLLWALSLEENSQLNLGKGKAYGYGRMQVFDKKLKIRDNCKAYDMSELILYPFEFKNPQVYINEYKNHTINGKKVTELPMVKALLKMKDITNMPDPEVIRYMSIDAREYQSRKDPLQDIDEVLNPKFKSFSPHQATRSKDNHDTTKGVKIVKVTGIDTDKKDQNKYIARFEDGMIFDVPQDLSVGETVKIKVTKENDKGYIFASFIGR